MLPDPFPHPIHLKSYTLKNSFKTNTMTKRDQTRAKKEYKNDLDVVNAALELAKQEKIRDLNTVAESYRDVIWREFHATRMRLLSEREWEFAIREEDLIKKPNKNVFQPTYPPVKLLEKSKNVRNIKHGYDKKTNKNLFIVAGEDCPNKIHVKYVEDVTGVENMPPKFLKEFVKELAGRFHPRKNASMNPSPDKNCSSKVIDS